RSQRRHGAARLRTTRGPRRITRPVIATSVAGRLPGPPPRDGHGDQAAAGQHPRRSAAAGCAVSGLYPGGARCHPAVLLHGRPAMTHSRPLLALATALLLGAPACAATPAA